jgi:protein-tyrosine phosphatase
MVDIHSHVLWGLDDGAQTQEESLAMLQMATETGTTDIVATPHSDHQYRYDSEAVDKRIAELSSIRRGVPRLHRGCDFHMSLENIHECLQNPTKFTINGLAYLMVEFDDNLIPPTTEEIFRRFMALDIIPVITHPERNPILRESADRLREWVEMDCVLQVTAQSLTETFGQTVRRAAWALLRQGLVHVLASDAHDIEYRPPRLDFARDLVTREMGPETAELLLLENPSAIIRGLKGWVRAPDAIPAKRSWFAFWR